MIRDVAAESLLSRRSPLTEQDPVNSPQSGSTRIVDIGLKKRDPGHPRAAMQALECAGERAPMAL
jgi:hypothetical protein